MPSRRSPPPACVRISRLGEDGAKARALELAGFPSSIEWAPSGNLLALALAPTPSVDDDFMNRKVHVVDSESGKVLARFETERDLGKAQPLWSRTVSEIVG